MDKFALADGSDDVGSSTRAASTSSLEGAGRRPRVGDAAGAGTTNRTRPTSDTGLYVELHAWTPSGASSRRAPTSGGTLKAKDKYFGRVSRLSDSRPCSMACQNRRVEVARLLLDHDSEAALTPR